MPAESKFDSRFGGAQKAILDAMGRPAHYYHWQAILLGVGGDDGYWMRLIGQEKCSWRRIGALVITPEAIGYSEPISLIKNPGKSAVKWALMQARGGPDKLFKDFTWTASKTEIDRVDFEPALDSTHGSYASVLITAHGREVRFGVHVGHPSVAACSSALRGLTDRHVSVAQVDKSREPRTDGLYVLCAKTMKHRIDGFWFGDGRAGRISCNGPGNAFRTIADGTWRITTRPYVKAPEGRGYVVDGDGDARPVHVACPDDESLIYQLEGWIESNDDRIHPPPCAEMRFIHEERLASGWGTVRAKATCPDWLPRGTPAGWIEARPGKRVTFGL